MTEQQKRKLERIEKTLEKHGTVACRTAARYQIVGGIEQEGIKLCMGASSVQAVEEMIEAYQDYQIQILGLSYAELEDLLRGPEIIPGYHVPVSRKVRAAA